METSSGNPIITLTTDFGVSDHYVGTMKGVLLSRCPNARIVDITHRIPAYSILPAAYAIDQAAPYFPNGTTHLLVVDPGVGTERKIVAMEALGQSFVAPDNGVLSLIQARDREARVRSVTDEALRLPDASSTFHGRDIFAPIAAAVASGSHAFEQLGPLLDDVVLLPGLQPTQIGPLQWRGTVLSVDRFGNVITNFPSAEFRNGAARGLQLQVGNRQVTGLYDSFGKAPPGVCFLYHGSSGYLEIAINQQNAAQHLGIHPGAEVFLRLTS